MAALDKTSILGGILAGGRSRRMGADKALMRLAGQALVARVAERLAPQVGSTVVNSNAGPDAFHVLALPVVTDTLPGHRGPLAGVLAVLRFAQRNQPWVSHIATAPVDTPFLPRNFVECLSTDLPVRTIALAASDRRAHPACSMWPVDLADDLEAWLRESDDLSMRAFLRHRKTTIVDFPLLDQSASRPVDPFLNVNTRADLDLAARLVRIVDAEAEGK